MISSALWEPFCGDRRLPTVINVCFLLIAGSLLPFLVGGCASTSAISDQTLWPILEANVGDEFIITLKSPIAERASCYRESRKKAFFEDSKNSSDDYSGLIFRDWYDYLGYEVPQYTLSIGILHVPDSNYGIVESSTWVAKVKEENDRHTDSGRMTYKSEICRFNRTDWVCLTTANDYGDLKQITEDYRLRVKTDFYLSVVACYIKHAGNEAMLSTRQQITRHLIEAITVDRITTAD